MVIKLIIQDQLPIAAISDIIIIPTELSKGILDEKTGKIILQMDLAPQDQKGTFFTYEFKYPKRERVILE